MMSGHIGTHRYVLVDLMRIPSMYNSRLQTCAVHLKMYMRPFSIIANRSGLSSLHSMSHTSYRNIKEKSTPSGVMTGASAPRSSPTLPHTLKIGRTGWILLSFIAVCYILPASHIGTTATTSVKVVSNVHARMCIIYCSNGTRSSAMAATGVGGGTPCVLQLDVPQMWVPHSPEPLAAGVARGSHRMTGRRAGQ